LRSPLFDIFDLFAVGGVKIEVQADELDAPVGWSEGIAVEPGDR